MLAWTLAVAAALAAITFLILWLRVRSRAERTRAERGEADWVRADLELGLAEHQGRLAIIRELHEVAIEDISRIAQQGEGAARVFESDPAVAARALAAMTVAARAALANARRVVTLIDEGQAGPARALLDISELVRAATDGGLGVTLRGSGTPFELKPGADIAVNRIVQGALSNSLQHGGLGTQVTVTRVWTELGLQLAIDDDGIRATAARATSTEQELNERTRYSVDEDLTAFARPLQGAGLSEMRQRAELFGGVFTAKVLPGVGFSVSAIFPALRYHDGIHGVRLER